MPFNISSVESQKGINIIQLCSLENQKIYGDSALLVLNGTLNTVNALLVLSGTLNTVNALLVLNGTLNTVNGLLVLNGTLNTVNALLVLNGTLNTVNALLVLNGTLNTVNALLVLNGTLNTVNALLVLNGTLNTVSALLVLNGTLNTVNTLLVLSQQHEVSSPVLNIQLRQLADPFFFLLPHLKSAAGMRYELVMVYIIVYVHWCLDWSVLHLFQNGNMLGYSYSSLVFMFVFGVNWQMWNTTCSEVSKSQRHTSLFMKAAVFMLCHIKPMYSFGIQGGPERMQRLWSFISKTSSIKRNWFLFYYVEIHFPTKWHHDH